MICHKCVRYSAITMFSISTAMYVMTIKPPEDRGFVFLAHQYVYRAYHSARHRAEAQ